MSVTKAIIIHGTGGSPQGNWFPWLKEELEKLHLSVIAPQFPIGDRQSLSSWMSEFSKWLTAVDSETMLIGHSIGPAFILNLLERDSTSTIAAAFLVAPFVGKLGGKFDSFNRTFAERDFDWIKIKQHCKNFFIYSSDNDPYVPLERGEFLSAKLNAKFKIVRGAGHINAESGFTKFPLLLDDIKQFISDPER
ncbi:MAG: serine hydrolase family protein [Candidatus Micrarchaeota archaeon]|nr:serine hydrolase family protein [Candidatus Micrarchaeota archaeon]